VNGSVDLGDILLYCFNAFHHACKFALDKNNASPLRTDRLTDELPTSRNYAELSWHGVKYRKAVALKQ